MGQRLHFQCRRLRALPPRPRDLRRRQRASGLAVRRARRQWRHPGCRQSRLEAGPRAARARRPSGCSTATTRSASPPPTRTSPTPTRATDFITPKSRRQPRLSRRRAGAGREHEFARRLVNSGRLSVPAVLDGSPLNGPDDPSFGPSMRPGCVCIDAPILKGNRQGWLFTSWPPALPGCGASAGLPAGSPTGWRSCPCRSSSDDNDGRAPTWWTRGPADDTLRLEPDSFYLSARISMSAARWRRFDLEKVEAAVARACGSEMA